MLLRQLVGQDRDKDQVIDAEHDFHHHKVASATQAVGLAASCKQYSMGQS
jgi:hypothetical protein